MFQTHSTHQSQKWKSIFYILVLSPLTLFLCIFSCYLSLHFTQNWIMCAYSPPRCVTWCALCQDERAPGFSLFTTSTDSRVSARRAWSRGEASGRRVVWMPLRSLQLTASVSPCFSVFFRIILVSLLPLLASLLSLSSLQTFPLLPLWNWSKISVPRHPGRAH